MMTLVTPRDRPRTALWCSPTPLDPSKPRGADPHAGKCGRGDEGLSFIPLCRLVAKFRLLPAWCAAGEPMLLARDPFLLLTPCCQLRQ
jgi:hypothetical protein